MNRLPFLFFLLSLSACTRWVEVPPPSTEVTAAGAFASDATAEATVNGLYSGVMTGNLLFLNGGTTVYPALSADELYRTTPGAGIDPFTQNTLTPQNTYVSDLWSKGYSYVYHANACLEGVGAAAAVSEGVKTRLSGEVLFFRALCYFYLTNLFGPVPLVLTTDYTVSATLPRADTGALYQQMVSDLVAAREKLAAAGVETNETRPSAMACRALLARVYLYGGDWSEAVREADTVINSGAYALAPVTEVFRAGSSETLFALSPVIASVNTSEGLTFIPYSPTTNPTYALTPSLISAFETNDRRRSVWLDSIVTADAVYYYPFKYRVRSSNALEENNIVLRLAELYLIRAEGRAKQGDIRGAVRDLNVIRNRADLPPLLAESTTDELITEIASENRVEFFVEWGHRWLDLKRTGAADAVLEVLKTDWQPTAVRYPIPYGQILLNGNLTQNEGY